MAQITSSREHWSGHGVKNAVEEAREHNTSVCIRKTVEMLTDVDILIVSSLSLARSVIEEGGTWEPLVHIVHPLGVQSMRVPGLHAGLDGKVKVVDDINHQWSVLKGILLITVADVWIGEDTQEGFVAISWDIPFSCRRKALLVEVQACCEHLTNGIQKYKRSPDGQVLVGEFHWGDPLA